MMFDYIMMIVNISQYDNTGGNAGCGCKCFLMFYFQYVKNCIINTLC